MPLIFLDANIYLEGYYLRRAQNILECILTMEKDIFIPFQTRNEVVRNRHKRTLQLLNENNNSNIAPLPDLLSSYALIDDPTLKEEENDLNQKLKEYQYRAKEILSQTVNDVCKGYDYVSKIYEKIFSKAQTYSFKELKNARIRKELGNPPGKSSDPLGDQLVWEQLLSTAKNGEEIWIVSNDEDFIFTYTKKEYFLNPYLYEELKNNYPDSNIRIFKSLPETFKKYKETYKVLEKDLPSKEDLEIAQEEIEAFREESKCQELGHIPKPFFDGNRILFFCDRCGTLVGSQPNFEIDD